MLAVTASARASAATLAGEVRLSQELRTPPLPEAHVLVGYCWQNSRCCQPSPLAAAQLHQRLRVAPELVISQRPCAQHPARTCARRKASRQPEAGQLLATPWLTAPC